MYGYKLLNTIFLFYCKLPVSLTVLQTFYSIFFYKGNEVIFPLILMKQEKYTTTVKETAGAWKDSLPLTVP